MKVIKKYRDAYQQKRNKNQQRNYMNEHRSSQQLTGTGYQLSWILAQKRALEEKSNTRHRGMP